MYASKSGLYANSVASAALLILLIADNSAAQAPSLSFTTFPGVSGLSAINGLAAGSDGALWFTGSGPAKNEVGRITTAGVVTEYPTSNAPGVIVAGPDGAL